MNELNPSILMNGRTLLQGMTGVQRYALELSRTMECPAIRPPANWSQGGKGYLWEQMVLPYKMPKEALLFSPGNVGPLVVRKQVVTIHDMATFVHPEWFSKSFSSIYKFLLPKLAKKVRHLITVSEFSKREIVKYLGVDESKVSVVYNGVSCFEDCLIDNNVRNEVVSNLSQTSYILYVGSIDPRKNLKQLLKVWDTLETEPFKLVIVGASARVFGNCGLDNLLNSKSVIFTGRVSDTELANLYKNATAFVYPSLYEGFGLPPLEAMGYGCPCLVSDHGSLPEVCGPDIYNGGAVVYFNPNDFDSIRNSLSKALLSGDQLRTRYSEVAKKHAAQFTWNRCAFETKRVLNSVL